MYRSNPFCGTKTPGLNMWKHLWTRKRENPKTRKREESTCGRENGENAKTAKTRKRRKQENRENGENAKTRKRRKPENAKTAKTTKARKRPKVFLFSGFQFLVFWFSRFSRFSGFLVPLAASFWPGRVFYVLRQNLSCSISIIYQIIMYHQSEDPWNTTISWVSFANTALQFLPFLWQRHRHIKISETQNS